MNENIGAELQVRFRRQNSGTGGMIGHLSYYCMTSVRNFS